MKPKYLPIAEVAKRWGRSVDHVRHHVAAGNLTAIDTSVTGKTQELVILLADVESFEFGRVVGQKQHATVTRPKNHFANNQRRTNSATARKRSSSTE